MIVLYSLSYSQPGDVNEKNSQYTEQDRLRKIFIVGFFGMWYALIDLSRKYQDCSKKLTKFELRSVRCTYK